jgi:hypothetical protein
MTPGATLGMTLGVFKGRGKAAVADMVPYQGMEATTQLEQQDMTCEVLAVGYVPIKTTTNGDDDGSFLCMCCSVGLVPCTGRQLAMLRPSSRFSECPWLWLCVHAGLSSPRAVQPCSC